MSGAPMPGASVVMVPDAKIRDYLLDPGYPGNGGKAAFFNAFGFTAQNWTAWLDALQRHPGQHSVVNAMVSLWGTKYEVRCSLPSPDGRDPCVRSFWIVDSANLTARLVTTCAY